jgi:hypothetical protein
MQARASVCCLGMADVSGDVVAEEGWWWWSCCLALQATTPASLPSRDHYRARLDLFYTLRLREGAATHLGAFGMVGTRSS